VSSAAAEAAAALAPAMASDLVAAMPLASDDQLAADLAAREVVAAAPETVPSSQPQTAPVAAAPAPAAAPETTEEIDLNLAPVIPDDLQALLDEPDFEEEAALEVAAETEEWDEDAADPETAKRLKTLEKRNAWLEDRVVKTERKKWVAENLSAYPLLARYAADEVSAITATSRRGFAREAAALNARLDKMVAPALEEIAQAKKALRGEVAQEVRGEYKDAWGTITAGPTGVPDEAREKADESTKRLRAGDLTGAIGALLRGAGVNNQ
jgi:hypothetical protein